MREVVEINQIDEAEAFTGPWRELLEAKPGATFFHSLPWLRCYWKHYGQGQRLRILVVRERGAVVGIVPLVVRTEPSRLGPMRLLTYPLHDWASFYSPIGPDRGELLHAALSHIRKTSRDWDFVELRWIGGQGDDPSETARAMKEVGWRPCRSLYGFTSMVRIQGDWKSYFAGHGQAWCRKFRRRLQRLRRQGEVRLVRYRPGGTAKDDDDPRWDLFDMCQDVAQSSWQAQIANSTTISADPVRAYFRDMHQVATRAGAVDMNLLLVDDSPAAFLYNYHWQGMVYGCRAGHSPQWKEFSPGLEMVRSSIQDSFERGDQLYDMGVGESVLKTKFRTAAVPIFRVSHCPITGPRTQLLGVRRWIQQRQLDQKLAELAAVK